MKSADADEQEFSAAEPEKFEQHVLALAREQCASEQSEDKYEGGVYIKRIWLKGEYPDTLLMMERHVRSLDRWDTDSDRIWSTPGFSKVKGEFPSDYLTMVLDFLMWARGG